MEKYIIGADEVGTGSLIGSFFVCAVKAPLNWLISGLNDSKKLSSKRREELSEILLEDTRIQYKLVEKTHLEIDEKGLGVCLKEAYIEAIKDYLDGNSRAIIDGTINIPSLGPKISSLVKADQKVSTVMAASIIAKVHRDNIIKELHKQYPVYGWDKNIGYGTLAHKQAIKEFGLCKLHRKSYRIKL